jgi:hypothetical protein
MNVKAGGIYCNRSLQTANIRIRVQQLKPLGPPPSAAPTRREAEETVDPKTNQRSS